MSGGSYNYLYGQDFPLSVADLSEMADTLDRVAPGSKAAKATRALLTPVPEVDALRPVWKAVEWWTSKDLGKDSVYKAVAEFETRRP